MISFHYSIDNNITGEYVFNRISSIFHHNKFSVSAALSEENDIENKNIKLGRIVGTGTEGKIYQDANNKNFYLKKPYINDSHTESKMREQVSCFNKYYGEGSAALIENNGVFFVRMYKVPGIPISDIDDKIFPPSAQERYQHMICDLGDRGIMHADLNFKNILYDKETNTFYPIDFCNGHETYHSGSNNIKNSMNSVSGMMYDWALKYILEHTY